MSFIDTRKPSSLLFGGDIRQDTGLQTFAFNDSYVKNLLQSNTPLILNTVLRNLANAAFY